MPKFYVKSGPIQLIFDAPTAEAAAVKAFQWTCDKQAEIQAKSPLDRMLEAEERGWQLWDEIAVSERGFGRRGVFVFLTGTAGSCYGAPHELNLKAAASARQAHADQRRKYNDRPYIQHPARVAGRVAGRSQRP